MTVLSIACDNCGASTLPETFTGTQAKCQKCGSVIDVGKQRNAGASPAAAAAKPAAPKPAAAARPAIDRSKSEPKPAERPARPARAAAAKAADAKGEDGAERPSGSRRERPERPAKKKSNTMPLALGGIGLVAVIVVVLVVVMGGKDPAKADTAQSNAGKTDGAAQAAQKPADATPPAGQDGAGKPADGAAPTGGEPANAPADPKAADPKAADGKPADASTAPAPPTRLPQTPAARCAHEKIKDVTTLAQVTDPKTYPEVAWPAAIDDGKKAEIRGLCDDVKNGGRAGIRAKPKLVENGWTSLFGIVETLRTLDYTTETGNEHAFEFHKMLEEMTAGQGTGFEQVAIGEPIDPRKAEFNARTVKAWRAMLDRYPDEASFKKAVSERKKKQADADK